MNSASQPLTGPSTELNLSQKNSFCRARNFLAVWGGGGDSPGVWKMCVEKLCKLCLTPWPRPYFSPFWVPYTLSLIQRSIGSGFVNWNSINITKTLAYAFAFSLRFYWEMVGGDNGRCQSRHFHIISPICDPFLGPNRPPSVHSSRGPSIFWLIL